VRALRSDDDIEVGGCEKCRVGGTKFEIHAHHAGQWYVCNANIRTPSPMLSISLGGRTRVHRLCLVPSSTKPHCAAVIVFIVVVGR